MFLLLAGLFVAGLYDYECRRIPNWLIALLLLWGLLRAWLTGGIPGLFLFVCLSVLITLVFYPFFRMGALGAGDVKLLGVCTPFLPCDEMLSFLFCTMVIGAFLGILHFAYYGNALERFRYLAAYIRDCLAEKRWKLYEENSRRSRRTGICMAGPILISTLLYLGGIY